MGDVFKGDYDPPPLAKQTQRQLASLRKYGPDIARTLQGIEEEISPRQAALNFDLYQRFFPEYSRIGSQAAIDQANSEAQAAMTRELGFTRGAGRDLVTEALGLERLANPEFYQQRELANQGIQRLLAAQDPSRLSGSELTEIERGLNRLNTSRGNINVTDATTTAANAGAFGSALAGKQARFGQALSLIPSLSAASRAPLDTFSIATGRGNQGLTNVGQQQFGTPNVTNRYAGLLPGIQQAQQDILSVNAGRRPIVDYANQSVTAAGSVAGGASGGCCFIMLSLCEDFILPSHIRMCRDYFYKKDKKLSLGYKKMSLWLVPLIKKFWIIRKILLWTLYKPLNWYGLWLTGQSKWGFLMHPIKNTWFNIWRLSYAITNKK